MVLLLGDSLTQRGGAVSQGGGWAARLAEHYERRADVLNRGLSGYNTQWVLKELPGLLGGAAGLADVAVIWLGANDAALAGGDSAAQHVPLEEYKSNLRDILQSIRGLPKAPPCLLVTPPAVDDEARMRFTGAPTPERTLEMSKQYAQACKSVACETHTKVCDMWLHTSTQALPELLSDGLHFSPEGEKFVYGILSREVNQLWVDSNFQLCCTPDGEQFYRRPPLDVPDWKDRTHSSEDENSG